MNKNFLYIEIYIIKNIYFHPLAKLNIFFYTFFMILTKIAKFCILNAYKKIMPMF